jgi:hypothetical protein
VVAYGYLGHGWTVCGSLARGRMEHGRVVSGVVAMRIILWRLVMMPLSMETIELAELKKKNAERDSWLRSTKPCKDCHTTGIEFDGWGRSVECATCNGVGRISLK